MTAPTCSAVRRVLPKKLEEFFSSWEYKKMHEAALHKVFSWRQTIYIIIHLQYIHVYTIEICRIYILYAVFLYLCLIAQESSLEPPQGLQLNVEVQPAHRHCLHCLHCPSYSSMQKVGWQCSWWFLAAWNAAARIVGWRQREWHRYQLLPPSKYQSPKLSEQEHRRDQWPAKLLLLVEACLAERG